MPQDDLRSNPSTLTCTLSKLPVLFQSYSFLFGFLPILLLLCQWLRQPRINHLWNSSLIVAASLIFYGWLSPQSLPFLLLSCAVNLFIAAVIHRNREKAELTARLLAGFGVALNVFVLAGFKYSEELVGGAITGGYFPLGASFITFVQIIYLIETLNGSLRKLSPLEYLQIATFFGYITSGPIVSTAEMSAQRDSLESDRRLDVEHLLAGFTLFAIGLFKKLVIADSLASYASTIFDATQLGIVISTSDAWLGSCFYMLQLYFDFSGYSDMAIGIGYLVGMRLPLNFNSPFKAITVMDYWRRWHMTLTRFITNYLYLPLAVAAMRKLSEKGVEKELTRFLFRVVAPTLFAFVLAGVWHGKGWNFFIYGIYWGVALCIYQVWDRYSPIRTPKILAWLLTMVTALASLVIFRSSTMDAATMILSSASGLQGSKANLLSPALGFVVLALGAAVVVLPNSQQILCRYRISSDTGETPTGSFAWLMWKATPAGAIFLGVTLTVALLVGGGSTQFLYYKF